MRYIIDIPDEAIEFMGGRINVFVEPEFKIGDCKHYALRICKDDITPYTKPDEDKIRQKADQEVWEFASMLMNMHPDVAEDIYWSMNGGKGIGVAAEMTYQEAKDKYNEWLKQQDEIKVGDEVLHTTGDGVRGVITKVNSDDFYVMDEDGDAYWEASKSYWRKTGRHFSEVAELLEKMKEDT